MAHSKQQIPEKNGRRQAPALREVRHWRLVTLSDPMTTSKGAKKTMETEENRINGMKITVQQEKYFSDHSL